MTGKLYRPRGPWVRTGEATWQRPFDLEGYQLQIQVQRVDSDGSCAAVVRSREVGAVTARYEPPTPTDEADQLQAALDAVGDILMVRVQLRYIERGLLEPD